MSRGGVVVELAGRRRNAESRAGDRWSHESDNLFFAFVYMKMVGSRDTL